MVQSQVLARIFNPAESVVPVASFPLFEVLVTFVIGMLLFTVTTHCGDDEEPHDATTTLAAEESV